MKNKKEPPKKVKQINKDNLLVETQSKIQTSQEEEKKIQPKEHVLKPAEEDAKNKKLFKSETEGPSIFAGKKNAVMLICEYCIIL